MHALNGHIWCAEPSAIWPCYLLFDLHVAFAFIYGLHVASTDFILFSAHREGPTVLIFKK